MEEKAPNRGNGTDKRKGWDRTEERKGKEMNRGKGKKMSLKGGQGGGATRNKMRRQRRERHGRDQKEERGREGRRTWG